MRRARFRLVGRFNGTSSATVIVEQLGPDQALISVRPFRSRRLYTLPLAAVARGVIYDVVRSENPITRSKRRSGNA
ncbi:MAG TPA: hypothetical protein VES65_11415 [Solirubrobacteraceae bacterium]|nr:hypothetical protein [Solirubrobacteraceae bacterium]